MGGSTLCPPPGSETQKKPRQNRVTNTARHIPMKSFCSLVTHWASCYYASSVYTTAFQHHAGHTHILETMITSNPWGYFTSLTCILKKSKTVSDSIDSCMDYKPPAYYQSDYHRYAISHLDITHLCFRWQMVPQHRSAVSTGSSSRISYLTFHHCIHFRPFSASAKNGQEGPEGYFGEIGVRCILPYSA